MAVPPESIRVGRCYLMETGHVRRVVRIKTDGRVQFMHRLGYTLKNWKISSDKRRSFASIVQREVPCDWMPATDEA